MTPAWRLLVVFLAAGCALSVSACDKQRPGTAPAPASPHPAAVERQKLDLVFVPASISAPADWEIKTLERICFVQGKLPQSVIGAVLSIQLSHQQAVTSDQLKSFLSGMQAEAAADAGHIRLKGPRTSGKILILEQVAAPRGLSLRAMTQPGATPNTQPASVSWNAWVFVPNRNEKYDRFLLACIGLDTVTYKDNSDFIASIFDSITYDPQSDLALSELKNRIER